MTKGNCLLILILLIVLAIFLASGSSSKVGGSAGLAFAPLLFIGGGPRGKGKHKKFEPVAGDRSGLEAKGEIEIKGKATFPAASIDDLIDKINKFHTFAPLNAEEKKHLEKSVAEVNKAHKTNFTMDDGISIRDIVVSQRIANHIGKVIEQNDKIVEASNGGKTALEIATEMKLPPLAVAKQILLAQNNGDMKKVNEMLHDRELLPSDMLAQIEEASSADHGGRENMQAILDKSAQYENKVAKLLSKAKIDYKTESQLKEEQTSDSRFGRPVATPDFFFKNPIKLNGNLINWIDAKNFPLFTSDKLTDGEHLPKIIKGMNRQALKYNKNFGRGAFVFAGGVQKDITLSTKQGPVDVDLVDGSAL